MKRQILVAASLVLALLLALPATQVAAGSDSGSRPPAGVTTSGFTYCHWTGDGYELAEVPAGTNVPQHRIDEHRAHGDLLPGEQVPNVEGPGKYLDENCQAVSWVEGVMFAGCAAPVESTEPCVRSEVGDDGTAYDPSGSVFPSDVAVVRDPGVEFASDDGAVQADFDGDHLTVTVAEDQPALDFVFGFGDWDLWDFRETGETTLDVTSAEPGVGAFFLETGSTAEATGPQSVTYRLIMEHSAGLSPLRETTITVNDATLPADGQSTTEVTVQLRDPVGQPPPDGEAHLVELFMNSDYGTIGEVIDHGGGRYTATLTAGTVPGRASIVGMADYLDLDRAVGAVELVAP